MIFQNPNGVENNKSLMELMKLFRSFLTRADDPHEKTGFEMIPRSAEALQHLKDEILWVGHSTLLINHQGVNVMTDPIFADRASPFSFSGPKRVTPLPFQIADLPQIDVVVISHSHYDHLDKAAVIELAQRQAKLKFLVPLGLKKIFNDWGITNVEELDWWQSTDVAGVTFTATPVQHWSSRTPFDRNKTLWAGWMVSWPDFKFYFTGDSGYCDNFIETQARLGTPDLSAIPIGAYLPRDFMKISHVNPEEAIQILRDLKSPKAVPIHWGTYKLTLEPLAEPPAMLLDLLNNANLDGQGFTVLKHGESTSIY